MAEQIVVYVGGALLNAAVGSVINWLCQNATKAWHRLRCFFGGRRGAQEIYDEFKAARKVIQAMNGINQDDKRYLIEDLKTEFMIRFPHRAYLFKNN